MCVSSGVSDVLNEYRILVNFNTKYSFHSITSNSNDASGMCAWQGIKYSTLVALLNVNDTPHATHFNTLKTQSS